MVSRPTQKSSPAPRRTTISEVSPAPSSSLVSSTAIASEAALPICGRLSVISSTGPLRAVRISSAMRSSPRSGGVKKGARDERGSALLLA